MPGHWSALRTAAVTLIAATLVVHCAGQQLTTFQGRGFPQNGTTEVFISAIVDRLIGIDDQNYRFEVVLWMMFTYNDPRARPTRDAATAAAAQPGAADCDFPCTTLYAWTPGAPCCDGVWLPHFEFVNARGFSQDRIVRYGIRMQEESDAVAWWAHVQGDFYTPFTFKAFPFDRQYLVVQLEYANKFNYSNIVLVPSGTGTALYQPQTGNDLSGWTLNSIAVVPFDFQSADLISAGGGDYSAPGDPWPLRPTDPNEAPFVGYLWSRGFNIVIEVERISVYYVITSVLPIAINTYLALLVFAVSPKHLDTRLGIVVTLFLSLTALQFIVAAVLPSSSTVVPTQQLVIASYFVLALIAVVSIGVHRLTTFQRQRERQRRIQHAHKLFIERWDTLARSASIKVSGSALPRAQQQQGPSGQQPQGAPDPTAQPRSVPTQQPSLRASPFAAAAAAMMATAPPGLPLGGADASQSGVDHERRVPPAGGLPPGPSAAEEFAPQGRSHPAAKPEPQKAGGCWGHCCRWWRLQGLRLQATWHEVETSPAYAMWMAGVIDRTMFWFALVGYNVALVLLFAIQAQELPVHEFSSN